MGEEVDSLYEPSVAVRGIEGGFAVTPVDKIIAHSHAVDWWRTIPVKEQGVDSKVFADLIVGASIPLKEVIRELQVGD